ncbi:LPS-induced tumor necrosis factor alpha factor [Penicillium hispanicum]|uniref:LPS-induced tumor necrosis factor alpha factor n=1 Tax=Penicillium hispanicum TaxID=1080232 RepID=UPI00254261DF|nr:LPS-induced tumor necrosis factor alpha factor [Penicillium hispanicum]KAJ5587578.1 LPS-induced tumor necrosis factor alpha factor [Penicillium hispanicum]
MSGRDNEGLIPLEPASDHVSPPVSPLHPSESANVNTMSPPAQSSTLQESDAPVPTNTAPVSKAYEGQPDPDHLQAAPAPPYPGQPPAKEYPGQPVPDRLQPHQYYNPDGKPSTWSTALPLHAVQSVPCPVDCPVCRYREITRTEAVSGSTTHGWAAVLCCCCCLGCIPYLMTSLKDVQHFCGHCGARLAYWHNSGRVDVLQTRRA